MSVVDAQLQVADGLLVTIDRELSEVFHVHSLLRVFSYGQLGLLIFREQIDDLLIINFKVAALQAPFQSVVVVLIQLVIDLIVDMLDHSRLQALLITLVDDGVIVKTFSLHRIGLACPRLPVSEDARVQPRERGLSYGLTNQLKDLVLGGFWTKDVIKCEFFGLGF